MITVTDYGLGNLASVANALEKLGVKYQISSSSTALKKADAIILPGVGAAGMGMKNLKIRELDKLIIDEIKKGKPFLGICLGMQLLFDKSEEGNIKCLGILKGTVKKFKKERKIPQIGWNSVQINSGVIARKNDEAIPDSKRLPHSLPVARNDEIKLFKNITNKSYFYFVNSFYCSPTDKSAIAGKTVYGESFASVVVKENVVGVQFHPEKSGKIGFQLLKNFIKYYVN